MGLTHISGPSNTKEEIKMHQMVANDTRERLRMALPGEWIDELDRLEFVHAGFQCLLVRNPTLFHWCGYVGIPPGHPHFGKDYDDIDDTVLEVHGGVTYADSCRGAVCHIPKLGEEENLFWIGFDCAHAGDLVPGMNMNLSEIHKLMPETLTNNVVDIKAERYRSQYWVIEETKELAEQLKRAQIVLK
jgi:hypothetical protein